MFFIKDFLEDLYYGATTAAYDLTHPNSWPSVARNIRSEEYSKESKKDMENTLEKPIEDKESVNLMEKSIDTDSIFWKESEE